MYTISVLVCLSVLTLNVIFLDGHPQCLDFRPPFRAAEKLSFCSEYSAFGCCTPEKDAELSTQFSFLEAYIKNVGLTACLGYFREILCQECSPYAAHIFDAEATRVKSPFPGLCTNYCSQFYAKNCSFIVPYVTKNRELNTALSDVNSFCDKVSLVDVDYCFPDILTNSVLNGEITREKITQDGCLCLEEFASNLKNPLLLRSPYDNTDRLFVAEQVGLVHIFYKNKTKVDRPFLNLTEAVWTSAWAGDERGFLGLAFHPQFRITQKFYVYYSVPHKIRISEFHVSRKNLNVANMKSERVLLEIDQPYFNHNGGEILFGVDSYLYLFVGDGGAAGDPQNYAQNKSALLGKVLRIDVDSQPDPGKAYKVPADNPFINEENSRPEIYAIGIRNIWRCDVDDGDPDTGYGYGRIICGDVGQNAFEEIDIIEKGGNYGWNSREGFSCFKEETCGQIGPEILPIHAYPHSVGKSITGGHVYRGCLYPNLNGKYIFGDYTNGKIFSLEENISDETWMKKDITMCESDVCFNGLISDYGAQILSFGEDDYGEIYMLATSTASTASTEGAVYKFVDPRRRGDPSVCKAKQLWKETSLATSSAPPYANNGWQFSWMPVTTCIMMPAWNCYQFYL